MENQSQILMSLVPVSDPNVLEEILEQDALWWENKGEVEENERSLTKLGKLLKEIHKHFRVLEPEDCLNHLEQCESRASSVRRSSSKSGDQKSRASSCCDDSPQSSLPGPSPTMETSQAKLFTFPRSIKQNRVRHTSGGSLRGSMRRQSLMRDSLALGRSPLLAQDGHGSTESLQSIEPNIRYAIPARGPILNLYRSALPCCEHPVLVRTQNMSEGEAQQLDILSVRDGYSSVSERLGTYLKKLFRLTEKRHSQYASVRSGGGGKQEALNQNLRQQLFLVENGHNPYYSTQNFQSAVDYKKWQDRERQEINRLLGNRIRARIRHDTSPRNRCEEYRELLKRVIIHDSVAECGQASTTGNKSTKSGGCSSNGSESDASVSRWSEEVLSKWGKRLLGEYAARYRVCVTTQTCFFIEVVEELLNDDTLKFDSPIFKALTLKFANLASLIEEGRPLCISELESVTAVTGRLIDRINHLVNNLLTEWLPTTKQLRHCLELASACFNTLDILEGNDEPSEWPDCLSKWLGDAMVEKYHSCKPADFKAETPEMMLASVKHAVDEIKMMQKQDQSGEETNYEAVFSNYIKNYHHAISYGLYEAVMTDANYLANALPWIKMLQHQSGVANDSLDLYDIALAYKLAEFDNLVKVREIDASKQNQHERSFPWRETYHRLAMHWLDVLSCHVSVQVRAAVAADTFNPPDDIEENLRPRRQRDVVDHPASLSTRRYRFGSLAKEGESSIADKKSTSTKTSDEEENKSDISQRSPPQIIAYSSGVLNAAKGPTSKKVTEAMDFPKQKSGRKKQTSTKGKLDSPCVLTSFKYTDDNFPDDSTSATKGVTSESPTFHSCTTTESSGNLQKYQSVSDNTTDKTIPSVGSESSATVTDGSTVVTDDEMSDLPKLVSAMTDTFETILPQSLDGDNPIDAEEREDVVCNVSSSLIDFVAIISRFLHFVDTILGTVYRLPYVSDFASCRDADKLEDMKNRFLLKALETTSGAVRQYAMNILSIDLSSVPPEIAEKLVGTKMAWQIFNGKYMKTVLSHHRCAAGSYFNLPEYDKEAWNETVACQIIVRLNNLLVLRYGLPRIWERLESSIDCSHVSDRPSELSTTTVVQTPPVEADHFNLNTDLNQCGASSDDTPQTSSSNKTAIYRGASEDQKNTTTNGDTETTGTTEVPLYDTLELNADGCTSPGENLGSSDSSEHHYENVDVTFKIGKPQQHPSPVSSDIGSENGGSPLYENVMIGQLPTPADVTLTCSNWTLIDLPSEDDDDPSDDPVPREPMAISAYDCLKEATADYIQACVTGTTRVLALRSNNWFRNILSKVLNKPTINDKQCDGACSRLTKLLDIFMKWIHMEGLRDVHECLWKFIIRDIKEKIVFLKQVDSAVSRPHAEHIQKVFEQIMDTWYRHPSKPNDRDLDWLTEPIRASLTLLELYSMPTDSLVKMLQTCREEKNFNPDPAARLSRDDVILCVRQLQDKKSFSGQTLCRTVCRILESRQQYSETEVEVPQVAHTMCQDMLNHGIINFAFKKTSKGGLPDLVPREPGEPDLDVRRSDSPSTGDSQESSVSSSSSSSAEWSVTDMKGLFHHEPNYFYQFSNRLCWSVIDDVKVATNTSVDDENFFLLDLLRTRRTTDKDAELFLLEEGYIQRGVFCSCFKTCFR